MAKNEFKTVNFTLAENVQLEMVEIPGYPGELENVPEEKMPEEAERLKRAIFS